MMPSSSEATRSTASAFPRTWDWSQSGRLVGRYVEVREVTIADGPRQLIEFELEDGERVTVWLSAEVLRRQFVDELRLRLEAGRDDFETNERIEIERGVEKRE